jgi:membrane protein implicated in regulation of membrane protease activity
MNVFNRAVVILQVLLLIVLLIVAAVVPNTVLSRLAYTTDVARTALEGRWPWSYIVFLAIDLVIVLVLVAVLWFELRPKPKRAVSVRNVSGGRAEVSTASIEQSLQYRLGDIPDVLKVKPNVQGKRGAVDVVVDLETTAEIDVPAKTAEVMQAARDVVEGKMGLKVSGIKVRIKQAPHGRVKTAPAKVETPVSPPVEPMVGGASAPVAPETRPEETPPQVQL